jgi:hypothetical protein
VALMKEFASKRYRMARLDPPLVNSGATERKAKPSKDHPMKSDSSVKEAGPKDKPFDSLCVSV